MEYRGIHFDIKKGIERDQWVWVCHTPKPREGRISGSRDEAISAAIRSIQGFVPIPTNSVKLSARTLAAQWRNGAIQRSFAESEDGMALSCFVLRAISAMIGAGIGFLTATWLSVRQATLVDDDDRHSTFPRPAKEQTNGTVLESDVALLIGGGWGQRPL
jgi:hypothetical protein